MLRAQKRCAFNMEGCMDKNNNKKKKFVISFVVLFILFLLLLLRSCACDRKVKIDKSKGGEEEVVDKEYWKKEFQETYGEEDREGYEYRDKEEKDDKRKEEEYQDDNDGDEDQDQDDEEQDEDDEEQDEDDEEQDGDDGEEDNDDKDDKDDGDGDDDKKDDDEDEEEEDDDKDDKDDEDGDDGENGDEDENEDDGNGDVVLPNGFQGQGKWWFDFKDTGSYGSTESMMKGDIVIKVVNGVAQGQMIGEGGGRGYDAVNKAYTIKWVVNYNAELTGTIDKSVFDLDVKGYTMVTPQATEATTGVVGGPGKHTFTGSLQVTHLAGNKLTGIFVLRDDIPVKNAYGDYTEITGKWEMDITK